MAALFIMEARLDVYYFTCCVTLFSELPACPETAAVYINKNNIHGQPFSFSTHAFCLFIRKVIFFQYKIRRAALSDVLYRLTETNLFQPGQINKPPAK